MQRVSISPSLLENWRWHRDSDRDDDTPFLERLGGFVETEAMQLGTAFHSIIEHGLGAGEYDGQWFCVDGWQFAPEAVELALAYREAYPNIIHEVRGYLRTRVATSQGEYDVRSSLRVDGIDGLTIHEVKTTASTYPVSIEDYLPSVQWQMYLLAFPHAQRVIYTKFQLTRKRIKAEATNKITKAEAHQFEFVRDSSMESTVSSTMSEFLDFLERRDLLHLLDRRAN